MMIFVSDRVHNIVAKGENADYLRVVKKSGLCGKELTHYHTIPHFQYERV